MQTKLRVLDIGNNFIQDLENVAHLPSMEEFWVRQALDFEPAQLREPADADIPPRRTTI